MEENNEKVIIIDNGSGEIKAWIGEEEQPKVVLPSYIGYKKDLKDNSKSEHFLDKEAKSQIDNLKLNHPIERGIIKNWDEIEKVYSYIFTNKLKIEPKGRSLLIPEPLMNPKDQKAKIAEIMLEKYEISSIFLPFPNYLSFLSAGKLDGISMDSGEGITQIMPIM